jgi:sugar phosphate isomerase/epimerase
MVQYAASTMFFHEYSSPEIFDYIEEAGCSGLEFWVETPHFWVRGQPIDEIRSCIADHPNLSPITVHAPVLDLNPCSINDDVAKISLRYALQAIEIGERLDATVMTFHPGRRTAKRTPSEADYHRFEHYIDTLREYGRRSPLRLAIENMEQKVNSLLCTPASAEELLEREPWLYFTLDIAHALASSRDDTIAYIENCFDRIVNIHISASRGDARHLPIFGDDDVAFVLENLRDYGYDKVLTLEIEDRNFTQDLCTEEKIAVIERDIAVLHKYFE